MAEQNPRAPHQTYTIFRDIVREEGVEAIPTADGDPKIIRLHGPIEMLQVIWEAIRAGSPPDVPAAKELEPNLVFIRGSQGAAVPLPRPEGGNLWMMRGVYYYALKKAGGLDEDMPTGRTPLDPAAPQNGNTIQRQSFRQDLLGKS